MRPCSFMPPGRFCVLMGLLRVMLARSHSPVPLPAAFVSVTRQPTTETEVNMTIINLQDYYPFYTSDCFMEVSEEVAEMFKEFDRKEAAYRLRTYRHKAYYSLDRDDGLEHEAVFVALAPFQQGKEPIRQTRGLARFVTFQVLLCIMVVLAVSVP